MNKLLLSHTGLLIILNKNGIMTDFAYISKYKAGSQTEGRRGTT